ncbi:MAG: dihydroneopterin aldolase [Polyangiaceae bacterium]
MTQARDRIHLRGLELECIVGVRPPERKRPQRVRVDVALGLDLSQSGRSGRITRTIDYGRVADEVQNLLRFREYRLMEMAAEELCAMLFAAHPMLELCELRLEKPEALRGRASATGGVSVTRERQSFTTARRAFVGGVEELVLETLEARLSLVTLEAGATFLPSERPRLAWLTHGSVDGVRSPCELGEPLPSEAALRVGEQGAALFVCETQLNAE